MKIRSNYVSNSSSSSFILDKKEDFKYFERCSFSEKQIYLTNDIKESIKFFIKSFIANYDFNTSNDKIDHNEVWNKYFENKIPTYLRYKFDFFEVVYGLNFHEMKTFIEDLPDDKWLTDSYDRDWACEYIPGFIKTFDTDL